LHLFGEFSTYFHYISLIFSDNWNRDSHPCKKDEYGVFTLFLPDANGKPAIPHGSKIKICITTPHGTREDRIPAWIKRVWQNPSNYVFDGVYWEPAQPYIWKNKAPILRESLKVYEAHVGMASQEPKCATYLEFARDVLPQIAELGYNAVQLMGIMEHAYYASFGYQVTNFFAASSRFGTPEELKELIDTAHGLGILVFIDLVHSHASKNVADGLNRFDGTDHCYFHEGGKGEHPIWDSRLFNYTNWEVIRFLLSNVRWYVLNETN
jgi:1,4-alpha-glucan branching enzyme